MCRQGYKLTEPFLLEELAQVIFLGGTDIDISHNQGVLLGVDELPQMLSRYFFKMNIRTAISFSDSHTYGLTS